VNDLTNESSLKKSRYSTFIFDDATTLVEAEASKNVEEEKNNEKDLLLHIFESSEHVISQRVMQSLTDRSVSKVTKKFFRTAQKQQKEQKKIRTQSKSKEKKVVSAST